MNSAKIRETAGTPADLSARRGDVAGMKEDSAMEFERLFARQLVREMTSGLFEENRENSMMGASGGLYREHVIDTLSSELARQEKLGMAEKVRRFWNQKISGEAAAAGNTEGEPSGEYNPTTTDR